MRTRLNIKLMVNRFFLFLLTVLLSNGIFAQSQIGNTIFDNVTKEILIENKNRVALGFSKDNTNGTLAGRIAFYELRGPSWIEVGPTLYGTQGEEIGLSYELTDDGNIMAVRATLSNEIRIYQQINDNWVPMGQPFGAQMPNDDMGAYSLSTDGQRIAISIRNRVLPSTDGIVQIYDWDGSSWNQVGTDVTVNSSTVSSIGHNISMAGNGLAFAVSGKATTAVDGELFMFRWNSATSEWVANGSVLGEIDGELFCRGLEMVDNGSIVAYTIPGDGGPTSAPTGSLRVLKQNLAGGPWIQIGSVIWGDYGFGYGNNFDVSEDGKRVLWEGKGDNNHPINCGAVRAYEFDGTDWNLIFEKYGEANESLSSNGTSMNGAGTLISTLTYISGSSSFYKAFKLGMASGRFYSDANQNCVRDAAELGIPNHLGIIKPGNYVVQTDSLGNWSINDLPDGNYTITIDTSRLWTTTCPISQSFSIVAGGPVLQVPDIGLSSKANHTDGDISVIMPIIRPCTNQNIYVNVCNTTAATLPISNGTVLMEIDPLLTVLGMSLPYVSLGNNQYLVTLDTIHPGTCIPFTVNTDVDCAAMLGQSVCIETQLDPNTLCYNETFPNAILPTTTLVSECLTAFDGSNLEVVGYCQNDSIYFEITNTALPGNDMDCYRPVIVFKNGIWVHADSVQLNAQQTYTLAFEGNGESWHAATYQHPLNPIISHPSATVENCGGTTLPSLISTFDHDDMDLCTDHFCDVVSGPFDPNDKRGYPLGFTSNKYVFPNGQMQYVVRFQNVGTDTAINVIIRDTIDSDLDILSLRPGPASHDYEYHVVGIQVIEVIFPNIRLPDTTTNNELSHGFFSFTINQNPNLAPGTYIHNSTEIQFDFNAPIVTNETERIVYYLLEGQEVVNSCGPYTWIDGTTYANSTDSASVLFQNSLGLDSIVHLDLTIHSNLAETDVLQACDSYTWIDGVTYTSSNNTATYTYPNGSFYGCDSTVYLDLAIRSSSSSMDIITECVSYTWINGVTYTASNNTDTYVYLGGSYTGCDSTVFLDLTIETVDIGVTQNAGTLTANLSGATYQWLDCDNNYAAIPGATGQSFTPTKNGNYALAVIEYNCTDTSACYTVTMTSAIENEAIENVIVYPNPTSGIVNIDLREPMTNVQIQIVNALGQTIREYTEPSTDFVSLEVEGPDGMYMIKIKAENGPSKWIKINKIN